MKYIELENSEGKITLDIQKPVAVLIATFITSSIVIYFGVNSYLFYKSSILLVLVIFYILSVLYSVVKMFKKRKIELDLNKLLIHVDSNVYHFSDVDKVFYVKALKRRRVCQKDKNAGGHKDFLQHLTYFESYILLKSGTTIKVYGGNEFDAKSEVERFEEYLLIK